MLDLVPNTDRLTTIFGQCAGAAFFLFATNSVVDLMNTRLNQLNDVFRQLKREGVPPDSVTQNFSARASLLRSGIYNGLVAAVLTVFLLVDLFVLEFFSADKPYGAVLLFALAACMLGLALVRFALEARLALREPDL
ncbi:MAG: DUF2721 domain-containing protein [Pseudomonadota bacterium]